MSEVMIIEQVAAGGGGSLDWVRLFSGGNRGEKQKWLNWHIHELDHEHPGLAGNSLHMGAPLIP